MSGRKNHHPLPDPLPSRERENSEFEISRTNFPSLGWEGIKGRVALILARAKNPENTRLIIFLFFGIFSFALALRLIYLRQYYQSPYWDLLFLDPESHQRMAERILSGIGMGNRSYFRSPAYFYLLAGLEYLARGGFWSPRIFQALLGSLTAALSGLFAFRITGKRWVMAVSGLIVSCFWLSVYFDGELLLTTSATFLNLLALYLLSFKAEKGLKWIALTGIISGLAIIFRPNFLLFSLAVFIWWIWKKQYQKALILILFTALPMLPITMRNLMVAKDFVPIASQDGINFWIGNSPSADGRTVILPLFRRDVDGEFLSRMRDDPWFREDVWLIATYAAEKELGHPVMEGEVSRFWMGKTLKEMLHSPGRAAKLFLKKGYFLIDKTTVSNDRDEEYHRDQIPILRWLGKFHLGWIMPLALLGIVLSLQDRKSRFLILYVLVYGFSIALFFVVSRYRMKLFPELAILAGVALDRLVDWTRNKKWGWILIGLILGAFFAWLSNAQLVSWNSRPLRSSMRFNLGMAMLEKGRFREAIPVLEDTLAIKPNYPEAQLALANALALSGSADESVRHFQDALYYAPDFAEAHYNFGLTLIQLKRGQEAYDQLLMAHQLKPEMFPAPEQVLEKLLK